MLVDGITQYRKILLLSLKKVFKSVPYPMSNIRLLGWDKDFGLILIMIGWVMGG